jgi:hypothetical protein
MRAQNGQARFDNLAQRRGIAIKIDHWQGFVDMVVARSHAGLSIERRCQTWA